jgi:hypothetical protein
MLLSMSRKSARIAAAIEQFQGQDLDACYLGFFDCFNRQLFYEAHDVLEELWLPQRQAPEGNFYKGLIQLAGAFVHLQKNRLRPAGRLLKLSRSNLLPYPAIHWKLEVAATIELIEKWLSKLESEDYSNNPLTPGAEPELRLLR